MRIFDKITWWVNIFAAVLLLLAYLSPYFTPKNFWFISILGLLYPILVITNGVFIIFWLVRKKWKFWLSAVCLIIGWVPMFRFVNFHSPPTEAAPYEGSIIVASYNVYGLKILRQQGNEPLETKLGDFVETMHRNGRKPDILCVQENNGFSHKVIREYFNYPYQFYHQDRRVTIYSIYEIIQRGEIDFGGRTTSCLWVDINYNGQTIRVYNAHLQSNQISLETEKLMQEADIQESETWRDIRTVFGKYRWTAMQRIEQANLIYDHAKNVSHPVIICGDFNDTPLSRPYRLINQDFMDSFVEAGTGIGTTYAGHLPFLRIDYIFYNSPLTVTGHWIVRKEFSDHYPIFSTLRLID